MWTRLITPFAVKLRKLLLQLKAINYILSISYFLSFIILIISFGIKFKLSLIEQDKEYYKTLEEVQQIHFQIVQNEIIKTLNLLDITHKNPSKINFLINNLLFSFIRISNITEHLHSNETFKIENTLNLANISTGFYTIQIDTNLLKYSISKNIPAYINFAVYIKDKVIVTNGEQGGVFIKNTIDAPFLSIITIILSINENHLLQNKVRFIKTLLLEFILILLPIIIINICFRKLYLKKIIKNFKILKSSNLNLIEEQNLLIKPAIPNMPCKT